MSLILKNELKTVTLLEFWVNPKKMLREYRSHRFLRKEISKWFSKYFQNWTTSVPVINFFPNFHIVELRRQKNEKGSTVLRFFANISKIATNAIKKWMNLCKDSVLSGNLMFSSQQSIWASCIFLKERDYCRRVQ